MKLFIYDGQKKVVKTYEASQYDLMFGTVEDVLNIVRAENLNVASNAALVQTVMELATKAIGTVKGLLLDIFDGLTEEELKHAKLKNIANILIEVVRYATSQMGGDRKN